MTTRLVHSHTPLFHLKPGTNVESNEQKPHAGKHWARGHETEREPHLHVAAREDAMMSTDQFIVKQEEATVEWIKRYTTEVHRGRIHVKTVFMRKSTKATDPNSAFAIFADAL